MARTDSRAHGAQAAHGILGSHLVERALKLGPPLTRDLIIQRDLRVPMPDGTVLLADRWAPRAGGDGLPLVLIRSPYGRTGLSCLATVRPLAERGFQVLIQSTRGTFGSGGVFEPMRNERADGLATLDWVVKQPWFGDSIVLYGASYLGYVQWAVADSLPPQVKAMIPQVTESALSLEFLRADGFSLETPFIWSMIIEGQEGLGGTLRVMRVLASGRRNRQAMVTLPLGQADIPAVGHKSAFIQDILAHDADDPYWSAIDHRERVAKVTVPVSSVGGWYDIGLPGQLRDFQVLQAAGAPARLTIGPWPHMSPDPTATKEAIGFGLAIARGEEPPARAAVRLYVMGAETWQDFESWPPPGYRATPFLLQPDGLLAGELPPESAPDRYRYDPADPTPTVGGARMVRASGRADNAAIERRPDVLTYTTAVLEHDVEIIGEVSAQIWFSSSLRHADVFVRLCDVNPRGQSFNVCDGLVSLSGADEVTSADVRLWPTAHRFKRGHRIRVQVSSGAFPRYNRNPGTGEPRATATRLLAADQAVYHDPARPSAIMLPVSEAQGTGARFAPRG